MTHSHLSKFFAKVSFLVAAIILVGCNAASATGTSTSTSNVLPSFADWRAAYMGADNHVHAVTLDGKTDVSGGILLFAPSGTAPILGGGISNAGIAPDGHSLAYLSDQGIIITDLTSGQPPYISRETFASAMQWSLDSHFLLLREGTSDLYTVQVKDGTITAVPGTPFPDVAPPIALNIASWVDSTHVLVSRLASNDVSAPLQFYLFDITSGANKLIATIPFPSNHAIGTEVSPDRSKILYFYYGFQGNNDPTVTIYDVASATSTQLTNLTQIQKQSSVGIQNLRWRPGTQTLALCTGSPVNHDLKDWLVDPLNDSVTQLPTIGFPVAWTPDGKTLIFSSDYVSEKGGGPYTITALHFGDNGQMTQTVLTTKAMNFNFIGLVHTTHP